MNKKVIIPIITAAVLLLLAACTQDEPGGQGNELPYGEYPLQIGGITFDVESSAEPWSAERPQTRVAEDNTDGKSSVWQWDGSEKIRVQLGDETANYLLNTDQSLAPDNQIYWISTDPATVSAWYPTEETVDFSDQSKGLAYVLKASVSDARYNQPVNLAFTHQLAKVRVVLSGTEATLAQSVEVYGYTTCTNKEGTPVIDGAQPDWLKMKHTTYADGTECWERRRHRVLGSQCSAGHDRQGQLPPLERRCCVDRQRAVRLQLYLIGGRQDVYYKSHRR